MAATEEKIERWRDFAGRMAHAAWPDATEARKEKIHSHVVDFIQQTVAINLPITHWDGPSGRQD